MLQLKHTIAILILTMFLCPVKAAIYDTDSLQNVLSITHQPSEKIKILNLLSQAYLDEDVLKAYNYARQALVIAESVNDQSGKAKALYYIAIYSIKNQKFIEALNFLLQSQDIFEKTDDDKWYAKVCVEIAKVHKRRFEYEKSLSLLFRAMDIFKDLNDKRKLADTYNNIGGTYYDQENYDKAYEYYNNSLIIWEELNEKPGLSSLYNNIGEIYRFRYQYSEALTYYRKSVKISKELNKKNNLAINYGNIGNIFLQQKLFDSALIYLNKSMKINREINDKERFPSINNSLGNLYLQMNNYDKALHYFKTGYDFALKNELLLNAKDAAKGLSKIYADRNQFKDAYYYHRQYKQISDSIFNIKNLKKITQLEMQLIFEHEQKLNRIKRQKTELKYFMIAAGLFSLLLVLILLYGRSRIKINHAKIEDENLLLENKYLQEEIDFKNKELATNVMYLVKKNELINFISEKLLKIKSEFKTKNQLVIQDIVLNLQSNVDTDIWKIFEQRFREVHREFYRKLNQKFPDLTENDKNLCALLRLNMSTKEIAAITHQNPGSIEVARTRLRKKLDLSQRDINLHTFLSNL